MITDSMMSAAFQAWEKRAAAGPPGTSADFIRSILESVEGHFEQQFANDQVRRLRSTGYCPTCGHESGEEN